MHISIKKSEIGSNIILLFMTMLFLCFIPMTSFGEDINSSYEVSDEIRLSTSNGCNYSLNDYDKDYFDFEYPKIFINENNVPIVAFVESNKQKLIFSEINNNEARIINKIDSFVTADDIAGGWPTNGWPITFFHNDEIKLGVLKRQQTNEDLEYIIQIHSYDIHNKTFSLTKEIRISRLSNKKLFAKLDYLTGIYSYDEIGNKYIIFGWYSDSHFHPLSIFSGEMPTFTKHFSLIWDEEEASQFQEIDKSGWFGAVKREYDMSESNMAHAAWIRSDSRVGFSTTHNENVFYSANKDGTGWTEPLELFEIKSSDSFSDTIRDLSITSYDKHAYLLWEYPKAGVIFADIYNGTLVEKTKIIGAEHIDRLKRMEPLMGATSSKIAVDRDGNVFVLWTNNYFLKHIMILKGRIDGKWTPSLVIKGKGFVNLPDMVIDETGKLHVVYLKGDRFENIACYYRSLTPLLKNQE